MTEEEKPWIVEHNEPGRKIDGVQGAQVTPKNLARVAAWCKGTPDIDAIAIKTPHGVEFANIGDWILKAPDGTFRVATVVQLNRSYEMKKR